MKQLEHLIDLLKNGNMLALSTENQDLTSMFNNINILNRISEFNGKNIIIEIFPNDGLCSVTIQTEEHKR